MSDKKPVSGDRFISQYREICGQKIKEIIKWLRARDSLTQTEFAKKIGINRSLICQYESGERQPSLESIIKLAIYSGQSIDSLIGLDEAKYKLNRGEEKVLQTLRKMSAGHELTVKKESADAQDIADNLIAVKQVIKI